MSIPSVPQYMMYLSSQTIYRRISWQADGQTKVPFIDNLLPHTHTERQVPAVWDSPMAADLMHGRAAAVLQILAVRYQ